MEAQEHGAASSGDDRPSLVLGRQETTILIPWSPTNQQDLTPLATGLIDSSNKRKRTSHRG